MKIETGWNFFKLHISFTVAVFSIGLWVGLDVRRLEGDDVLLLVGFPVGYLDGNVVVGRLEGDEVLSLFSFPELHTSSLPHVSNP